MKEEDLKIKKKKMKKSTFFEKPKVLHFYWNKNLNSLRCKLSKNFGEFFLGLKLWVTV